MKREQNSGPADSSEVIANKGANLELPDNITENEFSAILPRNTSSYYNSQEPQIFAKLPPNKNQTERGTICQSWLQKSSWRNLVGGMENKSFSITNVLPGNSSLPRIQFKSDDSAIDALPEQKKNKGQPNRKNSKSLPVMHDPLAEKEPSNDVMLAETSAEPQPSKNQTETGTVDTKSAKGQSWLQKSSWKDLIGGIGNSSFSITNVLPEIISLPPTQPKSVDSVVDSLSEEKKTKAQPDGKISKTYLPVMQDEHKEPQKVCEKCKKAIQEVGISDVCTFMRSAESQKEWSKARATLSRHLNKKRKTMKRRILLRA